MKVSNLRRAAGVRVLTAIVIILLAASELAKGQVQQVKIVPNDAAAGHQFGNAVAISGNTAVVGDARDPVVGSTSGSAYVFVRSGGTWTQQAKLTPSDAASGDFFGDSVAIDQDTIIIGADSDDDAGSNSGSAYVFVRSGTSWTQQQKLTASDAAAGDSFGLAVGICGDTAVIGSLFDDDAGASSGSAYVFVRSGTVWTQQQKLTASDAAAGDFFGRAVAIDAAGVIIGANRKSGNSGAAYVFVRSGSIWSQQQKLTASDGTSGDQFGVSVAIDGNTTVIGAFNDDQFGTSAGSAYAFVRAGTVWSQQAKLVSSDLASGDNFGISVGVSGNRAIIGAELDDDAGSVSGSAYLFNRAGTVWTQLVKLTANDAAAGDSFGISTAIKGDLSIVGAYADATGVGTFAGSAYVFSFDADGDGVIDSEDVCPNTPAGVLVDNQGRPRGDMNLDCHVNGADIALFTQAALITP